MITFKITLISKRLGLVLKLTLPVLVIQSKPNNDVQKSMFRANWLLVGKLMVSVLKYMIFRNWRLVPLTSTSSLEWNLTLEPTESVGRIPDSNPTVARQAYFQFPFYTRKLFKLLRHLHHFHDS